MIWFDTKSNRKFSFEKFIPVCRETGFKVNLTFTYLNAGRLKGRKNLVPSDLVLELVFFSSCSIDYWYKLLQGKKRIFVWKQSFWLNPTRPTKSYATSSKVKKKILKWARNPDISWGFFVWKKDLFFFIELIIFQ